ncbi:MAG: hypothetical protein RJB60_952 [Pseudomonadota bacterium]
MFAELEASFRAKHRNALFGGECPGAPGVAQGAARPAAQFPGPYLVEGRLNKPAGTSRVSPLMGYAEFQNLYVVSKTTKLFNPFSSGSAFEKAVADVHRAGGLQSLDQVVRILDERGAFARREGQEHHESAQDYATFLRVLQRGLTDLDRMVRAAQDTIKTNATWAAVLRSVDRLMDCQWVNGLPWNSCGGQVDPVLMSAVLSAGYGAFYATPSLGALKDMLRQFEGLVDSEGYKADRALLRAAKSNNHAPGRHSNKRVGKGGEGPSKRPKGGSP